MKMISCFAVWALLLFPASVIATADGPDCWDVKGVAASDHLNLRAEPSAKASILATIPPKAKRLENLSESPASDMPKGPPSRWCKVKYKDAVGWVNCKFLEEGSDCE